MSNGPKKKLRYQGRTKISEHKRKGKNLAPPFVHGGLNKGLTSWTNDRLPEMIWAAVLIAALGRDQALEVFRVFLRSVATDDTGRFWDATMTGFAELGETDRRQALAAICQSEQAKQALATLLRFDSLPARAAWKEVVHPYSDGPVELLMEAVLLTFFHQSQEATDCRWVRLMSAVLGGRCKMPRESLLDLNGYPTRGDQKVVRPSIRAAEGSMNAAFKPDLKWPKSFWDECWRKTPCLAPALKEDSDQLKREAEPPLAASEVKRALGAHWKATRQTTGLDAKHDAIFGIAFYALRMIEEILPNLQRTVIARLALRTLLELRLTLYYLLQNDNADLWLTWRNYGVGQAKLASLRLDAAQPNKPEYLDEDVLNLIANEDFWEEFVPIDIGHWAGSDLRKLSQDIGLKELYDRYYGWTSSFSHGQWGAIREAVFDVCLNPLHRGHRIPKVATSRELPTLRKDLIELFDAILADLDSAYPSLNIRLAGT